MKKKLLSRGLDPQSHRPLGQPCKTTLSSRPIPEHEIRAFQSPRTAEVADFFHYDRQESSAFKRAASDAEERPDLNLDLCI